jgi:hypothetical protein
MGREMAEAAGAGNNNQRNNRNNRNNRYNNTEEEMTTNTNRPRNTRNRRVTFSKTRKLRRINRAPAARPVGRSANTRRRGVYHENFPDEENVLAMIGSSAWASRIASESARIFAAHETLDQMLQALNTMPINRRVKAGVRENLQRKFQNLAESGAQ